MCEYVCVCLVYVPLVVCVKSVYECHVNVILHEKRNTLHAVVRVHTYAYVCIYTHIAHTHT